MSNTHPKPFGIATVSSDTMSIDEPDFSGLMALTEASIRRKLSELSYPDSDFSSSKDQNDPGMNVNKNHTSQNLQTKDTVNSGINQSKILPKPSESSDSSSSDSIPLTTYKGSDIEQPKQNGHDKQSQISEEPKKTSYVAPVNNNSSLLSAFDDPELVKIVSMGLNSKTDSNLKQSVKYCGLSVDLPTENKSPEAKQSPENVKHCGIKIDHIVEKRSSSPKLSFETVRKNTNIVTDSSTGKVSPPSRLSPESVKYCGLSMAVSSQGKPLKPVTNSSKVESVVRNIVTHLEKAKTEVNEPESDENVTCDIAPSERRDMSRSEVSINDQISEGRLNENSEVAEHERLTFKMSNASNADDENLVQDNNKNCCAESNLTAKSDECKKDGDNEALASKTETVKDVGNETVSEKVDNLASSDMETVEEKSEPVSDKSETFDSKRDSLETRYISKINENVEKNDAKSNGSAEKAISADSLKCIDNEKLEEHTESLSNKSDSLKSKIPDSKTDHLFEDSEKVEKIKNRVVTLVDKDAPVNSEWTDTEVLDEHTETGDNQSETPDTKLNEANSDYDSKEHRNEAQNESKLETGKDNSSVVVSETKDPVFQPGLLVTDSEMVDKSDEQASDNDLGLVISDVCSATEFAETDEIKESKNGRPNDELQKEETIQEPARKVVSHGQELHEIGPAAADADTAMDSDSDDAVSENETLTVEIESKTVSNNSDKCLNPINPVFSSLGNDSESSTLDSVDNDIKSLVATVSAELNSDEEKEGQLKSNFETISFSSERVNKSDSDIDRRNESQVTNQENFTVGSVSPCANDIAVTEVVSLDLHKTRDSLAVESVVQSPVNTELSALEGMVMRVTKGQKENPESRPQASSNESDQVHTVPALNISPSFQMHEKQVNIEQTGNRDEVEMTAGKTAGVNKRNDEMQTNVMNVSKDLVTSKEEMINKKDSNSHSLDSNLTNANEGKIMPNKDKDSNNSATSMFPVPGPSEDSKSGQLAVTQNSSLTENEDTLMITNVRTISLDELEAEQLSQEAERENDILPVTENVSERNHKNEFQNQNASLVACKKIQNTEVNELSSEKHLENSITQSLPNTSATRKNIAVSQSEGSKNSIDDSGRTYLSDYIGSISSFLEPVLNRSLYSIVPSRKQAGSRNFSSPASSTTVRETISSTTSAPAASNTGMPVIANTFTVKEEPIDYEPYGIPQAVASSSYTSTQPSNFQSYGRLGTPAGRQLNSQSSDQHLYGVNMVRQDNQNTDPKYTRIPISTAKQFVNIGKSAQILSGKVAASNSFMGPPTQGFNNTHASKGGSQNNANNRMQRRKTPVTVIMSQTPKSALHEKPLINKVNVSKPSAGAVRAPKVQTVKRVVTGPPVQPAQNHPSVVPAPANSTNVPKPKFAMNLKTINIETVGIPMITEMIARKNPVPVYKPSPPPKSVMGNEKTKQTFPCYECGDTFYFTTSLEQHIHRCSMKISYKCEWCKRILLFTNKCQLLSHLRSHMNIDKNQAVPIHIKSDSIEIQTNFDDIIPGKEFKWYKIPETEKETIPAPQEPTAVTSMSRNTPQLIRVCKAQECTECKLTFYKKDDNAKAIHYAPDKNVKPIFCGICPMYLRNYCGMKAHRRLHQEFSNLDFLVCPECGVCYENKIQAIPFFLQHIKMTCFHLSRFSSLKCTKCNRNCSSTDELQHHLTVSVEQYYKCHKCPMALKTLKSFKTHFNQTHKDKDAEEDEDSQKTTAKIIYRCHVCDTLIDDKEFLFTHIEKHVTEIKEQAQDYFHCLQCGLIFFDKKSLVYHYKQSHRVIAKENYCTLCRTLKHDQVEFTQHILNSHIAPEYKKKAEICEQCGLVCADQNGLRTHECHMKNVAFIVKGDSSASQKDKTTTQKEKISPQKEKTTTQKEKSKSQRKEVELKRSSQKQIKSENVSNFRNILPKPSSELDEIPKKFRKGCPACGARYWSNYKRVEHLRGHADMAIFVCIHCEKMDFKNYCDLIKHESNCGHGSNSDQNDPIPKHLSKACPSCDFIYGGNSKRTYHIKTHRGAKVFICLHCDAMNFSNYGELRSHEVLCAALSKAAVTSTDKSPSSTKIKLKFSKGKILGNSSPKKSEQYQLEYKCDECGQLFSRKEKQEEHTRLEHGIHPCHLCGLMYESQTSLKKHLLISHEGKKCVYYCWVCRRRRKFFSDVAHLQKHFTMKHKQKVWDPAKALPALPGFGTHDNKTSQPSKRRVETTPEKPDTPVKKLRIEGDKGFKCAKCDFTSEERKDFQAHIKEHKTDDSVQCIECGLCFMVAPSLKKHLFMVHKVRDFDTYLKEHGIEDLKEPEEDDSESDSQDSIEREEIIKIELKAESSEEEMGNPLECKVCYKAFDSEHSMKSHMRVHGMAFIKKTRRSLSSSAKRPKLDNTEQTNKTNEKETNTNKNSPEIEGTVTDVEMGNLGKES